MSTKPKQGVEKRLLKEVYEYSIKNKSAQVMPGVTVSEVYFIRAHVDHENGRVTIKTRNDREDFVFKDCINDDTAVRWNAIADLIKAAVADHVKGENVPF